MSSTSNLVDDSRSPLIRDELHEPISLSLYQLDSSIAQYNFAANRGQRVENPRQLAAAFAISVTARDHAPTSWVARNGEQSIFRTLQRVLPQVCFWIQKQDLVLLLSSGNLITPGHPTRGWETSISIKREDFQIGIQQGCRVHMRLRQRENPQKDSYQVGIAGLAPFASSLLPSQRAPTAAALPATGFSAICDG